MTINDILVVAPYNMQVNLLRSVLPEGARVGTVDKFQGQEAEVVIVSMTTSGVPRRTRGEIWPSSNATEPGSEIPIRFLESKLAEGHGAA